MSTAKDELTRLVQEQPEESSPEQIVRELVLRVMIRKGLADSAAGHTIADEEMNRRIRSWRS